MPKKYVKGAAEAGLAQDVVVWVAARGWEVYQEVQFHAGGDRADLVAVKDGKIWCIEAKTAASLLVMNQANRWPAHYRSIAVPEMPAIKPSQVSLRNLVRKICEDYLQIGVIEVGKGRIKETVSAAYIQSNERAALSLLAGLKDEQKSGLAAGSAGGGYITDFELSIRKVREFIRENPGCTIQEVVASLGKLHYATEKSARSSLATALANFESGWCLIKIRGGRVEYFVKEGK